MEKYKCVGKILFYIGVLISVFGFACNQRIGIKDTPEPLESLSLPLIVIGIIVLMVSNFFKTRQTK